METKIFLTNLAKYNEGILKGEWVNLPMTKEELNKSLKRILGEDEEYFITDFESEFNINEYENLEELNNFVNTYCQLDEYEKIAVRFLINEQYCSFNEALKDKDNLTIYQADSYQELAYEFVEEGFFGSIPENLEYYVDYEAIAKDLAIDYTEFEGYYISY